MRSTHRRTRRRLLPGHWRGSATFFHAQQATAGLRRCRTASERYRVRWLGSQNACASSASVRAPPACSHRFSKALQGAVLRSKSRILGAAFAHITVVA